MTPLKSAPMNNKASSTWIYTLGAIFGLILIAAFFRISGIGWDDNAHLHPDERFLTMVATEISWPKNIAEYFHTQTSPLNPHNKGFSFYVYGTYPVHLVKLASETLHADSYDILPIVGRYMSTAADLITLILIYCIASYLAGNTIAGLLAAFCYATAALPIQVSHFFTVDPYATLFATATIYRITRGKFGIGTGITLALAIGAKVSMILLIPVVGCAALIHSTTYTSHTIWRTLRRIFGIGVVTGISGFVTLRIIYPYVFDGWLLNVRVLDNWRQLSSFDGPTTSFPPGIQWIGVHAYQTIMDLMVWGLGFPLGIVAVSAIGYYVIRSLYKKQFQPIFIPVSWILVVWMYQSLQFAKPMRYLLPIYPAICVMSGIFLFLIFQRLMRTAYIRYFIILSICLLLVWPIAFVSIYTRQHTRVAASTWIYTHIPEKSTIAWEHWDDPLPFAIPTYSPSVYQQIQLPSFDPDDSEKLDKIENILSQSDYLILSSNRAYGALYRANQRFPIMTRFYTALFSGSLGFTLAEQFTSRPVVPLPIPAICVHVPGFIYGILTKPLEQCGGLGIQFVDDYADETFTVYDHPKVLIFQNEQHLSKEHLRKRIYE